MFNPIETDQMMEEPMRSTQQFSVTLPNEMAQMVKNKVLSGEYASESEVIRDGLRALQAREKALESWLRIEGVAAYDKLKADPGRARSVRQVRQHLANKRKQPAPT
jgi:antitoxin ParD1/3/4